MAFMTKLFKTKQLLSPGFISQYKSKGSASVESSPVHLLASLSKKGGMFEMLGGKKKKKGFFGMFGGKMTDMLMNRRNTVLGG